MTTIEAVKLDAKRVLEMRRAFDEIEREYDARRNKLAEEIKRLSAEWEEQNAELVSVYTEQHEALIRSEHNLRGLVIMAFGESGEKQVAPGISVRVNKSLKYDPNTALDWARTHQFALALDKKAFEKIASVQPPDFVETVETVSAVIAWDKIEGAE